MTIIVPTTETSPVPVTTGTSGTVGNTAIDVTAMIEHAVRRCGVLPSSISGEQQLAARESLYMVCADLANRGLSLWCVAKQVMGLDAGMTQVNLPTGTVDVVNALYRRKTDLSGTTISGSAWQGLDLGSGNDAQVTTVAVKLSADHTCQLILESSSDDANWTRRAQTFPESQALVSGTWYCFDAENAPTARYWRIRDLLGNLASIDTLVFSNNPQEVVMGKLNRDDYVAFPNKSYTQAGAVTPVYWFDKQISPRLWVWPAAGDSSNQIVAWTHRQIQDVGTFTNTLEVPARWYESIIFTLACRVALEIPAGMLPPGRLDYLEAKAQEHLARAEDGESDGSPIRLLPQIAGYTR